MILAVRMVFSFENGLTCGLVFQLYPHIMCTYLSGFPFIMWHFQGKIPMILAIRMAFRLRNTPSVV